PHRPSFLIVHDSDSLRYYAFRGQLEAFAAVTGRRSPSLRVGSQTAFDSPRSALIVALSTATFPAARNAGMLSTRGSGRDSGQYQPTSASSDPSAISTAAIAAIGCDGMSSAIPTAPSSATHGAAHRQILWENSIHANAP